MSQRYACLTEETTNPPIESTNYQSWDTVQVGFIYPIFYTAWVSNPIPVNKKQDTICLCTELCDLNLACLKDNFLTPFIDHLIDAYAGHEVLSFMDGFSCYNKIQIRKEYQYKTTFMTPWGTFTY